MEQGRVIVGKISGLYGVRGGVKIFSYTRPKAQIFSYKPWLINRGGDWSTLTLKTGKVHGKGLIAFFEGVADRDGAISLVGLEIAIEREQLPPLPEGEYYWHDLMGLEVFDLADRRLGQLVELLETGANDVLVVDDGQRRMLIPMVMGEVVKAVDLEKGLMQVDWNPEYI